MIDLQHGESRRATGSMRPQRRAATRRVPRKARSRPVASVAAGLVGLLLLLWLGAGGAKEIAENAVTTTTTVAPQVNLVFECPAPGAGYSGQFEYSQPQSETAKHEITVTFLGNEIYQYQPVGNPEPQPMTGLWPGVELQMTVKSWPYGTVISQKTYTTPPEPC